MKINKCWRSCAFLQDQRSYSSRKNLNENTRNKSSSCFAINHSVKIDAVINFDPLCQAKLSTFNIFKSKLKLLIYLTSKHKMHNTLSKSQLPL